MVICFLSNKNYTHEKIKLNLNILTENIFDCFGEQLNIITSNKCQKYNDIIGQRNSFSETICRKLFKVN